MRNNSAFTLLECLVVIAVLCFLAAIMLPVVNRSREAANRATCQGNLREIGLALRQYAEDHNQRLPARLMGKDSGQGETNSWRRVIGPYLEDTSVFSCPSNEFASIIALDNFAPRSYVCNGNHTNIGGTAPMALNTFDVAEGKTLFRIARPEETILVAEGNTQYSEATVGFAPPVFANDMFQGHLGNCNFLFADGHVKAMKPIATGSPKNFWSIENDGIAPATLLDLLSAWQEKVN